MTAFHGSVKPINEMFDVRCLIQPKTLPCLMSLDAQAVGQYVILLTSPKSCFDFKFVGTELTKGEIND